MKAEIKDFFGIDFVNVSIRQCFNGEYDIEVVLLCGEHVRFFVYPESKNFRLMWYGSSLEVNNKSEVLYLQAVSKIATVLSDNENLENIIDILRKA